MVRALLFLIVCLGISAGLVVFITDLPKMSTDDKKVIYKIVAIVLVAALLFFAFAFLFQIDNGHKGVLQ